MADGERIALPQTRCGKRRRSLPFLPLRPPAPHHRPSLPSLRGHFTGRRLFYWGITMKSKTKSNCSRSCRAGVCALRCCSVRRDTRAYAANGERRRLIGASRIPDPHGHRAPPIRTPSTDTAAADSGSTDSADSKDSTQAAARPTPTRTSSPPQANAPADQRPTAALLISPDSGMVLYEKNADEKPVSGVHDQNYDRAA